MNVLAPGLSCCYLIEYIDLYMYIFSHSRSLLVSSQATIYTQIKHQWMWSLNILIARTKYLQSARSVKVCEKDVLKQGNVYQH